MMHIHAGAQAMVDSAQANIFRPAKAQKAKPFIIAAAYTGAVYLTYRFLDSDIKRITQKNKPAALSNISKAVGNAGLGATQIGITLTTGAASLITKNRRLQKAAILLAGSHVINDLLTNQFKTTFQRHRPNTGDPYNSFDWRAAAASINHLYLRILPMHSVLPLYLPCAFRKRNGWPLPAIPPLRW